MKILSTSVLPLLLLLPYTISAALNGRCNPGGRGSASGVCVKTSDCTASGGSYTNGDCPNDPANVKCCYENKCATNQPRHPSSCMWSDNCSKLGGQTLNGYCAGPTGFKCCWWPKEYLWRRDIDTVADEEN